MLVEKTAIARGVLMACTIKRSTPVLQTWERFQQWELHPENEDEYQSKQKETK